MSAPYVGGTPWSARVPPDPPLIRIKLIAAQSRPARAPAADQGVRPTTRTARHRPNGGRAGVTLIEVLLAVTLLSLLTVGMSIAMRIGFSALAKTDTKLMGNRRVAGAQRILESELAGMVPVVTPCGLKPNGGRFGFFQGDPQAMRLVSTFSLQQGWRGQPQILAMTVIPGDRGGVRLVVNETPYAGPLSAGRFCVERGYDGAAGQLRTIFAPIEVGAGSFVLADQLAYCRFSYYSHPAPNRPAAWYTTWGQPAWPAGIRIEMAPLEPDPSRVQPITVVVPIRLFRDPDVQYGDY